MVRLCPPLKPHHHLSALGGDGLTLSPLPHPTLPLPSFTFRRGWFDFVCLPFNSLSPTFHLQRGDGLTLSALQPPSPLPFPPYRGDGLTLPAPQPPLTSTFQLSSHKPFVAPSYCIYPLSPSLFGRSQQPPKPSYLLYTSLLRPSADTFTCLWALTRQLRAAKSLCTNRLLDRCSIPKATWAHRATW